MGSEIYLDRMKDDLLEKFQAGKYKEIVAEWNRIEPVADGNKNDRILVAFSLYSLGELEDCESICGDFSLIVNQDRLFRFIWISTKKKFQVKD